jgi:hypothetical protein
MARLFLLLIHVLSYVGSIGNTSLKYLHKNLRAGLENYLVF